VGGEALHVLEVGLEEGLEREPDGVEVVEEGTGEAEEVAVEDGEEGVAEGGGDLLLVEGAEVSKDEPEHVVGVDLLEVVLADEGDLEGQGRDLQLVPLLLLQLPRLEVALDDDVHELLNFLRDESREQILLQRVDQRGGLSEEVLPKMGLLEGGGT
jgi:hypothetical protein